MHGAFPTDQLPDGFSVMCIPVELERSMDDPNFNGSIPVAPNGTWLWNDWIPGEGIGKNTRRPYPNSRGIGVNLVRQLLSPMRVFKVVSGHAHHKQEMQVMVTNDGLVPVTSDASGTITEMELPCVLTCCPSAAPISFEGFLFLENNEVSGGLTEAVFQHDLPPVDQRFFCWVHGDGSFGYRDVPQSWADFVDVLASY
jgi:hypothetical protein